MSTAFDRFDFADSDGWRAVENNLYFSTNDKAEQARVLLKRKRKWYKANIDPTFEWEENDTSSANTSSNSSSNSNSSSSQQQQSSSNSQQRASTPPPSSSPHSSSSSTSPFAKYASYISWVQLALHVLIILNVMTYLLPLLGAEQQAPSFTRVLVLNMMAQGAYLLRQHGRPQWNSEYGRRVFMDEQAHFFFLSIVLLNANPMFLLLAPFLSRSVLFVSGGVKQLLPSKAPALYALVSGPIEKVVSRYAEIYSMNALLEVLGGFMLVFNLLTPSRNIMLLFGYFQYLRIRAMLSADSKRAWSMVRAKTDTWVSHAMVPALVRTGYNKVVSMMEAATDQEQMAAQAQQPGIMSKCSIM